MRILVTGGAGYIGSILVPTLLMEGHHVTVLDNFMYGQASLLDVCHDDRLEIIRGDARDTTIVRPLLSTADVILPLACLTGAPACDMDSVGAKTINHDSVRMLYDEKSPSQMLIFPCTNSGYGVGQEGLQCDELSPMRPVSLYARLKVELEQYLLSGGECITFRFATVFGASPRMRLDLLVNDFTYRAVIERAVVLFEPHFKRNYLHVRDAASAFVHAIRNYAAMKGNPYNVGLSEANLSKAQLCEMIARHVTGLQILVAENGKDPDKRNYIISNARIEATGYRASVSLDRGIRELVKSFQILRRNQYSNV